VASRSPSGAWTHTLLVASARIQERTLNPSMQSAPTRHRLLIEATRLFGIFAPCKWPTQSCRISVKMARMPRRKTTVCIDDGLLQAAKVAAARTGKREYEVFEDALRRHLGFAGTVGRIWSGISPQNAPNEEEAAGIAGEELARRPRGTLPATVGLTPGPTSARCDRIQRVQPKKPRWSEVMVGPWVNRLFVNESASVAGGYPRVGVASGELRWGLGG
jgi:hypothetical protein